MDFAENFILSLFDTAIILLFVHSIKKNLSLKLINSFFYIVITSVGIAFVSIYITNNVISHILSTLISVLTLYGYLWIFDFKKKISCILIYFTVVLFLLMLQLLGIIIFNLILGGIDYSFQNGLIEQILNFVIALILIRIIPFSLLEDFIEDRNIVFSILVTTVFVLYYGITILWFVNVSNVNSFMISMVVMLLFAITINTIILREGFLSRIYKEKLSVYDIYFPVIENMIEELRSKQHDYHNQIQTILSMKKDALITDKEIEYYIDEINNDNIRNDLLKFDNKIISAFLYSKINEGNSKKISVEISIRNYDFPTIYSTSQLVEMYGILIDNAIETVTELHVMKKNIEISLYREDERNVFEIRNSHGFISIKEIGDFFKKGFTTKSGEASRGIGLYK